MMAHWDEKILSEQLKQDGDSDKLHKVVLNEMWKISGIDYTVGHNDMLTAKIEHNESLKRILDAISVPHVVVEEPVVAKKIVWEQIEDYKLQRLSVPGGWLVIYFEDVFHDKDINGMVNGWDWRPAMVFMPDPKHEWLKEVTNE